MSTFGRIYRVTTFGESHSQAVGCVIEGFPPMIFIDQEFLQYQLNRRRPGQSKLTTNRQEKDQIRVLSGISPKGLSLGTPITFLVNNDDTDPKAYEQFKTIPRPGHADYTYFLKYGINSESGGGRASARETVSRVCAGALAQFYLQSTHKITFSAWVTSVGEIQIPNDIQQFYLQKVPTQEIIDQSLVRCPHEETSNLMIQTIEKVKEEKDSIGGTITCVIQNVPFGIGEPCFDKLPALLAHAMLSIPACKGFEIGSGFEGTKMKGSQHNDLFIGTGEQGKLKTQTNNCGGTLGGISNGENIYFKVGFKPVSTIGLDQKTCDFQGQEQILQAKGRHDPCVLPRAVAIVESMAAIVIMDLVLLQK